MDEHHKEVLRKNRTKLAESVKNVDQLFPFLKSSGVLTEQDLQELTHISTDYGKVERILDILPRRGSKAFQALCVALESSYPHLVTSLCVASHPSSNACGSTVSSTLERDSRHHSLLEAERPPVVEGHRDPIRQHFIQFKSRMEVADNQPSSALDDDGLDYPLPPPPPPLSDNHVREFSNLSSRGLGSNGVNYSLLPPPPSSEALYQSGLPNSLSDVMLSANLRNCVSDDRNRDYDRLKEQCDKAMRELVQLQKSNQRALRKLDQSNNEMKSMKAHSDVVKQRLEQEIKDLRCQHESDRQEIAELRKQQRETMSETSGSEMKLYDTAVEQYESLRKDYDSLRRRYAELSERHDFLAKSLHASQVESARIKKSYEDVANENKRLLTERDGLKVQCTSAIQHWDNALKHRNDLNDQFLQVKEQRDKSMKEVQQLLATRSKLAKDLSRVTEEKNAAIQEYTLVMSERDTVHKEMEKLQDEISTAQKKLKTVEYEKQQQSHEIETLRREIASALADRDRAMKESHDLREKYGGLYTKKRDAPNGSSRDYRTSSETTIAMEAKVEAASAADVNRVEKEKDTCGEVTKLEADSLRKQYEAIHAELKDAKNEAEVAKRRRDWAFTERDKIVLERESLRTMCDKLRRERERAVSDLAEALRDFDDVKNQRNKAVKEVKELKEQIELQSDRDILRPHIDPPGHNHSRDSAIDTDLQEWEWEQLELNMDLTGSMNFGIDLVGGMDDPQFPNDPFIYVNHVSKNSSAYGKLKPNDCLLRVNNVDLTNADKKIVWQAMRKSSGIVNMLVRRRRSTITRLLHSVSINLNDSKDFGLDVEQGYYVSNITLSSLAAKEGNVAVGDRIVYINGQPVDNKSLEDVRQSVWASGDTLRLSVVKYCPWSNYPYVGHVGVQDGSDRRGSTPSSKQMQVSLGYKKEHESTSSIGTSREKSKDPSIPKFLEKTVERITGIRRKKEDRHYSPMREDLAPDESAVIANLNDMLQDYTEETQPQKSYQRRHRGRIKKGLKEIRKGGTWPKYHGAESHDSTDSPDGTIRASPAKKQNRTSIMEIIFASPKSSNFDVGNEGNERTAPKSRSFKVYHSPQSSKDDCKNRLTNVDPPPLVQSSSNYSLHSSPPLPETISEQSLPTSRDYHRPKRSTPKHKAMKTPSPEGVLPASKTRTFTVQAPIPQGHERHSSHRTGVSPLVSPPGAIPRSSLVPYHGRTGTSPGPSWTYRSGMSQIAEIDTVPYHCLTEMPSTGPSPSPSQHSGVSTSSPHQSLDPFHQMTVLPGSHMVIHGSPVSALTTSAQGRPHRKPTPSNQEVLTGSGKLPSVPSFDRVSSVSMDGPRGSPITPIFPFPPPPPSSQEIIVCYTVLPEQEQPLKKPLHRETRKILIEKGSKPLGIKILERDAGGIFISSVTENSLAAMAGLQVGDQLLDVCGINLRNAKYSDAAKVLQQCDDSVQITVQYNPDKFPEPVAESSSGGSTPTLAYPGPLPQFPVIQEPPPYPLSSGEMSLLAPNQSSKETDIRFANRLVDTATSTQQQLPPAIEYSTIHSNEHFVATTPPESVSQSKAESVLLTSSNVSPVSDAVVSSHNALFSQTEPLIFDTAVTSQETEKVPYSCILDSAPERSLVEFASSSERRKLSRVDEKTNTMPKYSTPPMFSSADKATESYHGTSRDDSAKQFLTMPTTSVCVIRQAEPWFSAGKRSSGYQQFDNNTTSHRKSGMDMKFDVPSIVENKGYPVDRFNDVSMSISTSLSSNQFVSVPVSSKAAEHFTNLSVTNQISKQTPCEPRFVFLKRTNPNLGINIIGGNAVGIFVQSVQMGIVISSGADGLRCGDQILEFNGVDLRSSTAEKAAFELSRPNEEMTILAQYNLPKYKKIIQEQLGDSFYIRAMFDYMAASADELSFKTGDILFIDNTMFNGVPGLWRAWTVDMDGQKKQCGVVPSKNKLEDDYMNRRGFSDASQDGDSRRGSMSTRRSFFRRRKHQRSNSNDSKDTPSFSNVSLNSEYSASTTVEDPIPTYIRVDRADYKMLRPVILIGPEVEKVGEKLAQDYPHKFHHIVPDLMKSSQQTMERGIAEGHFIDFKRRDSHFDCITTAKVKKMSSKGFHCILPASQVAIDRLHRLKMHPVVIFVKFKSAKQIRELKDPQFYREKISSKSAKELYDIARSDEQEYQCYITASIPGGSLQQICTLAKAVVEQEQSKSFWVPCGTL